MLLAALLLVSQAAPVAAPVSADPGDLVVMGEKLRRLRMNIAMDGPRTMKSCAVTMSSGDPAIDKQACSSASYCASEGRDHDETMADCIDNALKDFVRQQNDPDMPPTQGGATR
ncbi:hypothetical protein GCM10023219_15760 [Stakelama sediminis]